MQLQITIDSQSVDKLLDSLASFQRDGLKAPIDTAAKKLEAHLKTNIAQGRDAEGKTYPDVVDNTMELPIKYAGAFEDGRIRGEVSQDRTAMNVTGETKKSIYTRKVDGGMGAEIGFDSPRTELVTVSNAQRPGNISKPIRDPLGRRLRNPTDLEFDIVADLIDREIDRMIDGL